MKLGDDGTTLFRYSSIQELSHDVRCLIGPY